MARLSRINPNVRNVAIIVALALAVDGIEGGRTVANVVGQSISLAFLALLGWIVARMYREHRTTLYSLGTRRRALLYSSVGVAAVVLTASSRMLDTSAGTVAWLALLIAAAYTIYGIFRSAQEY